MNINAIKELRNVTGAPLSKCKEVLVKNNWNVELSEKDILNTMKGSIEKKSNRTTSQGIIDSYIHQNRIGAIIELNCETDFVAMNDKFKSLSKNILLQIVSINPTNLTELLDSDFVKDNTKTIKDLIDITIIETGENILIKRFSRLELDKD